MLVDLKEKAYVFPLSALLNPLNNTKKSIPCQMFDYNEVQKEQHHGYFTHEDLIKCHPLEEDLMNRTQKKVKEYLDGQCSGPSRFLVTVILDEQYPHNVMVFSVQVKNRVHTFYVPLCNFINPVHWPRWYKGCYLPF